MSNVLTISMRWTARLFSLAYVGFVVFMFVMQTVPAFNNGQVQHFTTKEATVLVLLGLYCISLLLAWKKEVIFGSISLLLLAVFMFAVNAWSAPYFLIGFIPPVLYIAANLLKRNSTLR